MTEQDPAPQKHRNDIYADDIAARAGGTPAIPAATVVLLRDVAGQPEVLMLHKASQIAFGGMWVFPGGRIDPQDYPEDRDTEVAARGVCPYTALRDSSHCLNEFWLSPDRAPLSKFSTLMSSSRSGQ